MKTIITTIILAALSSCGMITYRGKYADYSITPRLQIIDAK